MIGPITALVSWAGAALPWTHARRLLILMYHRVHRYRDPMCPGEVDAETFAWQMHILRNCCTPVSLGAAVDALRSDSLPPRAIAVTFDDGYADNATVALPILQANGIPATFFVAPGFLDGGRMWNDSVIEAIRSAPGVSLDLTNFGLGVVTLGSEAERGAIADAAIVSVKHLPPEERLGRVDELCERIGADLPTDLMMTSGQVRELAAAGMEIGAHTMRHPILKLLSDDAAQQEIQSSREALEGIIGRRVRAFAYPNGRPGDDYTERDRDCVERLGFDFAVSTRWGVASRQSDTFQLPRFTPWDTEPACWLGRVLLMFRQSC